MHVKKSILNSALDPLLCVTSLPPVQFASAAQAATYLIARDADVPTAFLLMVPKSQFPHSSKGIFAPNTMENSRGASSPWILLKKYFAPGCYSLNTSAVCTDCSLPLSSCAEDGVVAVEILFKT